MPWLAYLLSLHFLSIAKVSGKFIKLNIALQLCIFALSIFGTFILRSGLATSVHSFASDPLRGFFIVLGGVGVLLPYIYYAFHMHYISNKTKVAHPLERYIKIGMLLVFIILIVVFVGTMYPILDIRVSVRANFFNLIIVPLVLMLMSLMLVGFNKSAPIKPAKVLYVAIFSILAMYLYFGFIKILALLGVFLANLMICQLLFASKSKHFKLGHIGFCITALRFSLSPNYEIELERLLEVGDSVNLHKYVINFVDIQTLAQANNIADIAKFDIFQAGKLIKTLSPQRRIYVAQELVTAETAIWSGIFQDVCISISEELENGWAVRLCYKPFVRLIWLGGIVMATAAFSKRKLNVK
jgi:cytochrome c-type biogenesis protein CcmF